MGKKLRVWIMRIVAVLIVMFMVIQLGSSMFRTGTSQKNNKTVETKKKASKYTYVSMSNTLKLEGINQTILLPDGMTVQEKNTDDTTGGTIYNYGSQKYDDFTVGVMVSQIESAKGADLESVTMVTMEEHAEGLKNGEYSNVNYITFKGESDFYVEEVQTIYDDGENQYKYEVDYHIFDLTNQNYYVVSLFLLSPESPTKTDYLKIDRMGQEILSKTSFNNAKVYDEYGLPAESTDRFNHIN